MKSLLSIRSSLHGAAGESSKLADEFIAGWRLRNPHGRVVIRDLAAQPVPHLTAERFKAFGTAPADRTADQQAFVELSDSLIAEVKNADTIVLAVPMYNFSVPSTLRAYFDHIARVGVTFRYTSAGPEGLLKGKHAFVFTARGGVYAGEEDTQTPYLRQFLGFLGLDPTFTYAEGLAMGEESRQLGLAAASTAIANFGRLATAV